MEKDRNEEVKYIDLFALLKKLMVFLRQFWAFVLALTLLGSALMYIRAVRSYRPMYRSEAVFSVSVNYSGATDIAGYSYYYDRAAAKLVTETFPYLLSSDVMKELVCQRLGTSYINGSITPVSNANTNLFTLTVTSSNAQDAYDIIRAVIDVYPQVSRQVIGETQLVINREPKLPTAPYNTLSWHRSVAVGALGGFALSMGLLVVLAALRKTALSTDDVKKLVNLSCLAQVPNVKLKQRKSSTANSLLITRQESDSPFCEAFRLLRLKLLRKLKPGDQVIMVTSTVPSEGKSSLAVNTALSLAQNNKKVLIIDADLRGPSIKSLLNMTKPSSGMGEYLMEGLDTVRFQRFDGTKLYVFAGDTPIHTPTHLFQQDKLHNLIESLRPMFDYIVVDTPPCAMMADASALSPHVDKVLYIIREDFASTTQIFDGIQALSATGVDICGYVFNRTSSTHSSHYGYGYGRYGYGKKYGYGYGYSKYTTEKSQTSQSV